MTPIYNGDDELLTGSSINVWLTAGIKPGSVIKETQVSAKRRSYSTWRTIVDSVLWKMLNGHGQRYDHPNQQ